MFKAQAKITPQKLKCRRCAHPRGCHCYPLTSLRWGPRYAWEDFPECALYNSAGLPMPPFNVTLSLSPPRAAGTVTASATALEEDVGLGGAGAGMETVMMLRKEFNLAHAEIARLKAAAAAAAAAAAEPLPATGQ